MDRVTLSEAWQPEGFILRVERVETPAWETVGLSGDGAAELAGEMQDAIDRFPPFIEMESCYTLAGDYIGDIEWARRICGEYGIAPEKMDPSHSVCSIGFSAKDQKWYGWSHRAMRGFGVGAEVKRGDSAYVARDMQDFMSKCMEFWRDPDHLGLTARETVDADGRLCVEVSWTVGDVPNVAIRGERHSSLMYPPSPWGRGEWVAVNLDDAKQMAKDFAESVG